MAKNAIKTSWVNFITGPVFIVSFIIVYLIRDSLPRGAVIVVPTLLTITTATVLQYPYRNNRDHRIYYFFHPTKFMFGGVLVGIILAALLYVYALYINGAFALYGLR